MNDWIYDFGKSRWRWSAPILVAVLLIVFLKARSKPTLSAWQGDQTGSGPGLSGQAAVVEAAGNNREGFVGAPADPDIPWGNPIYGGGSTVVTQGYGVGSHAPASIWGGLDLAIDSNGDGTAEPGPTYGHPVYATHSGVVTLAANSWPAGNHISLQGERYRTGYAHLSEFAVADGSYVERGALLGYVGSTGMSSGPHLHYDVWYDGANIDPSGFNIF